MADRRPTIFQNIGNILAGRSSVPPEVVKLPTTLDSSYANQVLYSTKDKEDYERKLLQYKQQKYLSYQWVKAGYDNQIETLAGLNAIRLMYRDADLMDGMPEIGSALDIIAEEACNLTSEGKMVKVRSKSKRIKAILEDLFDNRLNIHVMLPMVCRSMIKYGNEFMLLNISQKYGVMGWRELPVYEIDRLENAYTNAYVTGMVPLEPGEIKPEKTKFIWVGHNESTPYQDWMVSHFRLLKDSFYLPYGTSLMHKARRAWRMWSMMEDAMLIYRLDKSVERRVFKIYVGSIDDKDVPAFVQDVANNFKRTPIIDPLTGQIDLRKNFLDVSSDYFIPVRDPSAPTPIENLPSAQNPTSMDDINYMQNKVCSALRVPKTFLNFQEAQGKGQNLSLMDIRFARMVNTIQQFLLMELNHIAMVHLHFLGLDEEITNFTLSMNNPSAQIEALELEDLTKRINTATAALTDPGTGIPILSHHYVLKHIIKLTDSEIKDILNEIRLEKAMAAELQQTANIIKKTGMFDDVDRIYGDYDAMHNQAAQQPQGEMGEGGPGAMGGGGGAGGGFDGGVLASDSLGGAAEMGGEVSDAGGNEASVDMSQAPGLDNGTNESARSNKSLLMEKAKSFTQRYFELLSEAEKDDEDEAEPVDYEGKTEFLNEQIDSVFAEIDKIINENEDTDKLLLDDIVTENDIDDELSDDNDEK